MGQDSSVGIATNYRLDGPRFSAPIQPGPGAHPASYRMGTGYLSREVKQPGCGIDHPHPSSAKVKELYPYSPFGHSSPVLG